MIHSRLGSVSLLCDFYDLVSWFHLLLRAFYLILSYSDLVLTHTKLTDLTAAVTKASHVDQAEAR